MNSKKPFIRPSIKTENSSSEIPRRAAPKTTKSINLGPCLLCGGLVTGPTAIRLKHGCVSNRRGIEFLPLPFDDQTMVKWLCIGCALDNNVVSDDVSGFSTLLNGLKSDGQCCLCGQVIEPYPLKEWSSAILIEFGMAVQSNKGPFHIFHPSKSGHLHYFCLDDLNLELWRIIERTDEPDYQRYLPTCI